VSGRSGEFHIQETVWLGDTPVATLRPNGSGGVSLYYVHADHLNTPRLVSDTSNNVRWRWDSDAFGTTPPDENPSSLGVFTYNLRFPGQQYDPIAGLNYNYFRDYDPAVGRYTQADPIGLKGGVNPYRYVGANPLARIDPLGLAGRGPFQPSPQTALEEAIVSGNVEAIGTLTEAGEISSTAAERAIAEIAIRNRSTDSIKQLAELLKRNRKAIEDAIHKCKENLPRNAAERNPNVVVDKITGEVYPLLKNGRLGDSIGNILDALAGG
jgi:RHS repeat-associated protein